MDQSENFSNEINRRDDMDEPMHEQSGGKSQPNVEESPGTRNLISDFGEIGVLSKKRKKKKKTRAFAKGRHDDDDDDDRHEATTTFDTVPVGMETFGPSKERDEMTSIILALKDQLAENLVLFNETKNNQQRLEQQLRDQLSSEQQLRSQLMEAQQQRDQLLREQLLARDQELRAEWAREQRDQERRLQEQLAKEQQAREQLAREQLAREQQARDQQAREQQARDQQAREQRQQARDHQQLHEQPQNQQSSEQIILDSVVGFPEATDTSKEIFKLLGKHEVECYKCRFCQDNGYHYRGHTVVNCPIKTKIDKFCKGNPALNYQWGKLKWSHVDQEAKEVRLAKKEEKLAEDRAKLLLMNQETRRREEENRRLQEEIQQLSQRSNPVVYPRVPQERVPQERVLSVISVPPQERVVPQGRVVIPDIPVPQERVFMSFVRNQMVVEEDSSSQRRGDAFIALDDNWWTTFASEPPENFTHLATASLVRFQGERGDNCAVCMTELVRQTFVTTLSCGHSFHSQCLRRFFQSKRGEGLPSSCPICRAFLVG